MRYKSIAAALAVCVFATNARAQDIQEIVLDGSAVVIYVLLRFARVGLPPEQFDAWSDPDTPSASVTFLYLLAVYCFMNPLFCLLFNV